MALVATTVPPKDDVARLLAQAHFSVEPGVLRIFRVVSDAARENDPREPIKLLEVNSDTVPAGILPVYFGPHNASGILYPSVVIEVTPEEYEAISHGRLTLPNGWVLGPELPRTAA
jgi:hypothetical protein